MKIRQFSVTVDYVEGQGWEADVLLENGEHLGWESTDVHTLLAAVGRDLEKEV